MMEEIRAAQEHDRNSGAPSWEVVDDAPRDAEAVIAEYEHMMTQGDNANRYAELHVAYDNAGHSQRVAYAASAIALDRARGFVEEARDRIGLLLSVPAPDTATGTAIPAADERRAAMQVSAEWGRPMQCRGGRSYDRSRDSATLHPRIARRRYQQARRNRGAGLRFLPTSMVASSRNCRSPRGGSVRKPASADARRSSARRSLWPGRQPSCWKTNLLYPPFLG